MKKLVFDISKEVEKTQQVKLQMPKICIPTKGIQFRGSSISSGCDFWKQF